jgi:hypothetical protein
VATLPRDLDAAMAIDLSAGSDGGYDPIHGETRLEGAFGPGWRDMKATLDAILATMMAWGTDWKRETLVSAGDRIERQLAERMSDFGPTTRRAMANDFTYQWK